MTKDLCNNCKWYLGGLMCAAYERIPSRIVAGTNDHEEVQKDQDGEFIYEKRAD